MDNYLYKYLSLEECFLSISFQPPANPSNHYEQPRASHVHGYHGNGLSPSSPPSNSAQHQLSETNLYIKNLPPDYSDKDLAALVEGYVLRMDLTFPVNTLLAI